MPEAAGGASIMMVAGEASGDLHGGNLAAALKRARPDLRLFGMGGDAMRRQGVDTLVDISNIAVVGLWEVLAHFGDIRRAFHAMRRALVRERPRLVVLIDYPDFNLRLAREAVRAGVPVVYYISPQVWAWRGGRVRTMGRLVKKMLVVYPFEEEFYRRAGIDCSYVGNPLLDALGEPRGRRELAATFGLDPRRPILGILPGSRRKELSFHLPVMLQAYRLLKESVPGLQGIIPMADTLGSGDFSPYLGDDPDVVLAAGDTDGVMWCMDAAAVASGTATLQTALHRKPMVIIYRLSPLTYLVGRALIRGIRHIGMVNIVAGEEVVPELIQGMATAGNIADRLKPLFLDERVYAATVARLDAVKARLGAPGASDRAAAEILRLVA